MPLTEQLPKDFKHTKVIKKFEEILKIPRESKNEEEIKQYLIEFADKNGLKYRADEIGNVAIDIPPSEGYEDMPLIILQGHMDMVCEGGNDMRSTVAEIVDGKIQSKGRKTTLGADNGVGLGMGMAIAEDSELKHGPITILSTVQEETGCDGAENLGQDMIAKNENGIVLINLDSEEGSQYICKGSAGGQFIYGEWDISSKEEISKDYFQFDISLDGLLGGHSGCDIHLGHGNAIKILNELLEALLTHDDEIKLISFNGGKKGENQAENAIPKAAFCRVAIRENKYDELVEVINKFEEDQKQTLKDKGKGLNINTTIANDKDIYAIARSTRKQIMEAIKNMPEGSLAHVEGDSTKTEISSCQTVAKTTDNEFKIAALARAATDIKTSEISDRTREILEKNGSTVKMGSLIGSWEEPANSPAVILAKEAYKKAFKKDPILFSYHAGLELSGIVDRLRDLGFEMDISSVSIGPLIKGAHSPDENVDIESIDQAQELLRSIIKLSCENSQAE